MATENNILEDVSATNTGVEGRYSTTAQLDSNPNECSPAESIKPHKLPTENICKSEHCEADKMENQAQKQMTENETQPQKGVLNMDVETGDNKVEANDDIKIEETDHDKEDDGAKISRPSCVEEMNPKVHEEESYTSLKVIPESIVNEENTRSKGEEAAAATSISETNLDLVNEAILPNLDLKTKSQGEENERVIGSYTKNEDTETTIHVEDEIEDISLTGVQSKKADMPSLPEGEWNDPESIGSSDKLEHDNNREEDASTVNVAQSPHVHNVEESTFEVASEKGTTDNDNSEEQDGGKKDLLQKNELEDQHRVQIILIPEEIEIAAARENAEKRVEQNIQDVENFEEKKEKDGEETSISTEKSLPLAESIEEIKSKESTFPPKNANDSNSESPLVEEAVQPDSGEIGIVSKTEAEEKNQESSKFCTENNCSETQSTENLIIKHTDSEAIVTTEAITKSTMDIEEHEKVPETNSEEKIDIKVDEKILPGEPKEMEEITDKQSHETAKERASEDEAPSRLSITELISDETIEQSNEEGSLEDGESRLIEKNESHKLEDAEEEKNAIKAFDPPKSTGGQETGKQQIIEGSVDETKNNFEDNEKDIQCSRDDTCKELKDGNYVIGLPPEFIQNTGLEEKHSPVIQLDSNPKEFSLTESKSSVESSSAEKSPTENISRSECSLADKTENKELTETSENERQNKKGLQIKDVETGCDKIEVINDINIEKPDHDIEDDGAKISVLTCAEEEETSTEISSIDQHLELITDQDASFKEIPESVVKDENTRSKEEVDADLAYNESAISISKTNLGLEDKDLLPNLDLKTKSQDEEDEREIESSAKDEDTKSTIHVEDEFNEICLAGEQNKIAEMPSVLEGAQKDPEPIGSSEENIAQSPCVQKVEESTFEALSRNGDNDNDDDKSEDKSSNLVTEGGSTKVAIEGGNTLQEASCTAEKDKNNDICESEWQQIDVSPVDKTAKAEDLACLNRDVRGADEEGLTETNEVGKINPERHEGEKRDSGHKDGQEVELGEQVILVPEKTEIEAPRENAENGVEQNIQLIDKIEETEYTEKSLPLAESITENKSEERIFPPTIANDLNSEGPLIEETGQPESGETGEVSKTEVEDKHLESNKFLIEKNSEHDEHCSEKQSIENLAIKHTDSEATMTTETITNSTKNAEELEKVSESLSEEKIDIKDDEKIIPEQPKEMEEATYASQETAKESASEDEATSRLPTTASISDEMIEQSIKESLKDGESTLEEKNDSHKPENDAEEKEKAPEAFHQPEATREQETSKQHIIEGSVDETKNNFEDNEKEIQCSSDDTGREFKDKNYVTDLPHEFTQNTGLEERYPTVVQLDSNPKESFPAELESSVESSSADKSPTENISRPEHSMADKKENEELTEISEKESKNQEGLQIKDDEKEGDEVEAIINKNVEEPDHDIENDRAKISMLTFSEEPNLKVHEEGTSMAISFNDQHLELTHQQASFKVIPESVVKDENTISKGEEDAILEYNLQDERDIESTTKDEHTARTICVEDEFNEICLAGEQKKEAEMPSVLEDEQKKDPEPIGSSDNLEHENNREEDASAENVAQSPCVPRVEESTFEAASRNGDNDEDKSEDKSSNLLTDGGSTEVVIEGGETQQEASYTADKDKNKDIYESEWQQNDERPIDEMAKAEDLACPSGDVRGIHEEGLIKTNEVGEINPESHEGEKKDSSHKDEQDVELGEHVIFIPEKTENAAPRENFENVIEQNIQQIEKSEETEEKDEPTSTHDTGETSISTDKSLPLAESITDIKSEERIFPQKIENDSNPEGPLDEEIVQPESGETGEVSKTEAEEKHLDSSKICIENEQDEHYSETQRTENLDIKHTDLEAMLTEETITISLKGAEELQQVPESHYEKKNEIKGDEKVIPEASKETEEANDKQSHETAKESEPEDEALERLSTAALIRDETIEQSIEEESLKDTESTLIEKNDSHRPETTAEENINAVEAFDLPKATDGLDICKQQIREGSVEETMNNFNDNEKEIQSSREDTDREIKEKNYVPDHPPEFIQQNTELEERDLSTVQLDSNTQECSTAEPESSVDLSSHDQSPTEYICTSEHCHADKIENEELTGISENERQNQNGVISKDVETGDDKVKVINDINIEEPGHDIKNDEAKISMPTSAEQSNLKVQEEETSMENSSLDQHQELITDQFLECLEKDKNTRSKGEEDDVLECNEQVTSTSVMNMCKINEASLPNLDLTTKSQGEEDEREEQSSTKDEDIDTTIHVDDEFKEKSLTGVQNKKAEIPPVLEFERKDPEHIRSSSKLEEDNNKEEDASFHRVEEDTIETASRNGDNDDNKSENQSSNLVADETSTQAVTEAGETLQEASYTACQDNNKYVFESVRQEIDVTPVEDSACLNRDVRAEKEDDIIQMGLTEIHESDKINLEKHDKENEQEDELGEQVIVIPEKTETAAPGDNAEKIVQQDVHSAENFDEKEEKDEPSQPTSTPDTRETEKSFTLVEPVTKSEELNSKYLLAEEAGQPDSDETDEVSKTDAEETHQEPGDFSTENSKHDEHHSETQSTENFAMKHTDSEAMVTTETITESTKEDTKELEKVTESHTEEKIDIKGDEKIIQEEPKDMEEATDKQSHKTAKESVSEDEVLSRLPIETSIRDETVEQSFQEESLHGELTFIEKESHRPEDDAEENIRAIEAEVFDLPKTTGGEDTSKQQIIEGSVEEKMNNFQENEKEIQSSMEDTGREIKGTIYISDLRPEFIKDAEPGENYLLTAQLDSNPNECSSAESKNSMGPSSPDKSPTENIHTSERFQADKIENQPLTHLSENESQHQKGVTCKDAETGSDEVEAIIEENIEQDLDSIIENDGVKIPQLACPEKPNPKVHEEETSIDNTSLDQHLELITDQQATSEVIAESMKKEMITPHTNENTGSKGEENVDLECNEQAASISKTNLGLVNEALLPNLDLKNKIQGDEAERVIESCTKDDDTDSTIHVEDDFNKISLAGVENKKADILSVPEEEGKDPESIGSSDKLEHEDNREEDASTVNAEQSPCAHRIEESTIVAAASRNGNESDNSSAIPTSNLITDGTSAPVKIDTAETLQEPSHTACQDINREIQESALEEVAVPPVDRMAKAEDSACLNKDVRGTNKEDIIQTGLTESKEDSKIDPEKHDGEKIDSPQNNEEEDELEEQVSLIPEKTEIVSQTEDAENEVEQDIHPGENFDEKEEKDRLISTPDTGETSISIEKSFPPDESITKISEERTIPQIIVNDLNSTNPLVEETGQPDRDEISEVSNTEAEEKHQESSRFSTENNKQDEQCSETQSTESLVIKHTGLEALEVTTETITKSSKDAEESEQVPESHPEEKNDIKGDEKIKPEEPKEMDEATDILFVETETPLITHNEGASILGSSDNDKEKEKEYSNEGIQKQNDGDQPMHPDLKTENISESDTGYIIKGKREQVDGLADQNEASNMEIVEDETSIAEVTKNIEVYTSMNSRKALLQEEELADKTEDSLAATGVAREAAELKAESPSIEEEFANTDASEPLMEKGASVSMTQDQSEETPLHSSNNQTEEKDNTQDQDSRSVQQGIKLGFQGDTEPNMKDEDLSNLPLTQEEDTKDTEFTQEAHQRLGIVDNKESINEHPTESRITSPEEEKGNKVEVSTSEFTEHIDSTVLTEEKKPVTLEDHTEQNKEIAEFSTLKSTHESETYPEVFSSTSKVYEKETEVGFIKRDYPTTGDPKIVPVIDEIEEISLKNAEPGHVEYEKGSDIAIESKGETEIATIKTSSDHIDITEREENSRTEKGILEELNEGHLKKDSCVDKTDKTTTVQDERELATSSIPISQDYPKQLVEEKDAMHNATSYTEDGRFIREETTDETAEAYLAHSTENTSLQKEHGVVKLGGVSELESVEITKECSNEDSSKLEKGGLNMVSDQKSNNSISDTASIAHHDDSCKLQENLATTFEGSLTCAAKEKAAIASETKDFSHENEPADEFPSEKTVEAAETSEEVELASRSTAKDRSDEKIYQAEEESNLDEHISESTESVPGQNFQGEILREVHMQFEVEHHTGVPINAHEASVTDDCTDNVLEETKNANGSEHILEHTQQPKSNLKEPETLSAGYEIVNEATIGSEERESRILENLAKANDGFSSLTAMEALEEGTHKEESEKSLSVKSSMGSQGVDKDGKAEILNKDVTNIFETLPCIYERKDVATTDKVKTCLDTIDADNIQAEPIEDSRDKQSPEKVGEGGQETDPNTRDKAPKSGDEHEKDSSNEIHEKGGTPEVVIQLEHQEKGEKEKADSLLESEQIKEATALEEAANLNLKTIENTFEFVQSEITIAAEKTMNTQVSDEKIKEEQEAIKDSQEIYVAERDKASDQETEQSAIECPIKKTDETLQTSSNDNQHEVKTEAIGKVEYENIKDILLDDTEGKNVTEAAKSITQENQGTETKITGERTEVVAPSEKEPCVIVGSSQREHIDTAEVSECTREEIQKLEESSWEKVDINLTEKADFETRKMNDEDVQHRPQKEEEPLEVDTHLDEATAKIDSEKDDGEDENHKVEPLSGASAVVETSKDRDVKVAHKKSHNILSGVGSKVKHSISKVKKAITGKSSHPKTSSPK